MEKTPLGNLYDTVYTPGATLAQVLAVMGTENEVAPDGWKISADDVTTNLACAKRYDLLEEIKSIPEFTELAETELRIHLFMEKSRRQFRAKVAQYPTIFQQMQAAVEKAQAVGLFSISYPCCAAQRAGLGEGYMAVAGDGLFLFAFKVISLADEGALELVRIPSERSPKNFESNDVVAFRKATGCNYGDILTGQQVLNGLHQIFSIPTAN